MGTTVVEFLKRFISRIVLKIRHINYIRLKMRYEILIEVEKEFSEQHYENHMYYKYRALCAERNIELTKGE